MYGVRKQGPKEFKEEKEKLEAVIGSLSEKEKVVRDQLERTADAFQLTVDEFIERQEEAIWIVTVKAWVTAIAQGILGTAVIHYGRRLLGWGSKNATREPKAS